MVYNFSKDSDYHTQINNKIIPLSSCNTTSMIMALKQAGIDFPYPYDMQAEDYLTMFLRTPESYAYMKKTAPWFFDKDTGEASVPPNEVHKMLEWGVNTLVGEQIVRFSDKVLITDMIEHLKKGGGIVLSGNFPVGSSVLNHVVSLAGFITDDDGNVTDFFIDDPYGDYRSGYKDHRGNDIVIGREDFIRIIKPARNALFKWAHLVGRRFE